ncbi:LuxR C-terminal-related transcriptional regulator [Prescottella sp. R16]|uniref:helix-turn-helix transcriptional regulator n=1 Tax=Prescottella sp. R16 TaxID=3064529 RepID=UPI00272DED14|nr:LuxR C-terminal-related transcriptional regulator [Prescottella sp. R16]
MATGKTALLACWRDHRRAEATAWATLDASDNNVDSLRNRLKLAVDGLEPTMPDAVLVLDDGHVVDDPAAVAYLTEFVDAAPFHVLVAARRSPRLPWPKFAAEGRLSFLGWQDLAWDRGAVAEEFARYGCTLADDDLDLVHEITGGWAGAVRSAALLFGADGRTRPAIVELRDRPQPVSGYVVGETIAMLPTDLVRALRSTSVSERFTRRQFVAAGVSNADPALYLCEQHGIPVSRERTAEGLVYAWHPLVRMHMKSILQEEDPDDFERSVVAEAHSLARAGRIGDAFARLPPTVGDDVVGDFVHRYGPAAVFDGAGDAVLDTLGASHDHLPGVRLLRALAALEINDPNAARAHLHSAGRGTCLPGVLRMFAVALGIEAAVLAGRPVPEPDTLRREQLSSTGSVDIDGYVNIQFAAALMLSRRYRACEDLLRETLALVGADGHPRLVLRVLARLAIVAALRGDRETMEQRAERAVAYAVDHNLERLIDAAQSAATVGMARYYRGESLPDSGPLYMLASNTEVHLRPDGTEEPVVGGHADVTFALLRARHSSPPIPEDAAYLARALDGLLSRGGQPGTTDRYVPEVVAVLVDAGRVALADDIVRTARDVLGDSPDLSAAQAIVALANGDIAGAEELGRRVLDGEPPPKRVLAVQGWVLVAVAAFRDRRTEQACSAIRQALLLAEPDEVVRPFLNYAGDTAEMLSAVRPGDGVTVCFLDRLRGKLVEHSAGRNPGLTRSEKTVLAKLRTGKVLRLIAEDMHLSVNTVRTHARNVYRKLDVAGREEAVEEAVRRGLL